jgi:hypothetical protein
VTPKRPKVEPIRSPTFFEMGRPEDAGQVANSLHVERPYYEPGLLLGTSAFTAAGWEGSFYPAGMKPRDRLSTELEMREASRKKVACLLACLVTRLPRVCRTVRQRFTRDARIFGS